MTDIERIKQCFRSGSLVKPSSADLNFVDLIHALMYLGGAEVKQSGPGVEKLCRIIGNKNRKVLILIDGLGANLLKRLPAGAFLRKNMICRLQSVFPSTTATALTTLATGLWPCSHGIPGWWTYLEEQDLSTISLPFRERFSGKPLEKYGITTNILFPCPGIWSQLKCKVTSIKPFSIVDSVYSRYSDQGIESIGYSDLDNAFEIVRKVVEKNNDTDFTMLYLPELDTISHALGPDHNNVLMLLEKLSENIARLADFLESRARILITADHGQNTIPEKRRYILRNDDDLLHHLKCWPTCEPVVPVFHVISGREKQFYNEFTYRFGENFALLTAKEVEDLQLFGPYRYSSVLRSRIGTFIGIALQPAALIVHPAGCSRTVHTGFHAGLSENEMYVPLIVK